MVCILQGVHYKWPRFNRRFNIHEVGGSRYQVSDRIALINDQQLTDPYALVFHHLHLHRQGRFCGILAHGWIVHTGKIPNDFLLAGREPKGTKKHR